jgi:hypothetical protein
MASFCAQLQVGVPNPCKCATTPKLAAAMPTTSTTSTTERCLSTASSVTSARQSWFETLWTSTAPRCHFIELTIVFTVLGSLTAMSRLNTTRQTQKNHLLGVSAKSPNRLHPTVDRDTSTSAPSRSGESRRRQGNSSRIRSTAVSRLRAAWWHVITPAPACINAPENVSSNVVITSGHPPGPTAEETR